MKNRIFVILICLVLMLGLFTTTAVAAEVVESGSCGENVTWMLTDDGTLTISGEGEMEDYKDHYGLDEPHPEGWDAECVDTIVIENGVTRIGNHAFRNFEHLTEVRIPDSVTVIGEKAFAWCTNLVSVEIPNSVTNIEQGAFAGCYSLESVTIHDGVKAIGHGAFNNCDELTSITIPASVTEIGNNVFGKCDNLKNIRVAEGNQHYSYDDRRVLFNKDKTVLIDAPLDLRGLYIIPESVIEIREGAFGGCENINKIIIPESVQTISERAFYRCLNLAEVTILEGATSIGKEAFYECENLTKITIPESMRTIGESAFENCFSLIEVTIPEGVTKIGDCAFFWCWELRKVTISETVDSIGYAAFSACHKLTEIIVDEDNQHFASEKGVLMNKEKSVLVEMTDGICKYRVPESVTVIGEYAFVNNYSTLQELWFKGDAPELVDGGCIYSGDNLIIHYPKNKKGWKEIIEDYPYDDISWKPYTPISTFGWVCIGVAGVVVLGGAGFGTYKLIKKRKSVNIESSDN